ncbi:hypothetical protein MXB_3384 [Myxobolus squamalis]|nr:hypothetical protein MXB_3384 [Myxobolus squamalis]
MLFIAQFNTLRQLCCNPFYLLPKKNKMMQKKFESAYTIDEVMQKLIEKKRADCEELNRNVIMYNNGLAAVQILADQVDQAITTYKSSINLYNENKPLFGMDKLQDESLKMELNEAIIQYLENSAQQIISSKTTLNSIMMEIEQIEHDSTIEAIFQSIIAGIPKFEIESISRKITNALLKEKINESPFCRPFNFQILEFYMIDSLSKNRNLFSEIIAQLGSLEITNRKIILKKSKKCCVGVEKFIVDTSYNNKLNENCPFCNVDIKLRALENLLYDKSSSDTYFNILKPEKTKNRRLLSLKTYFLNVRSWFTAQDEIQMCCKRLTLSGLLAEHSATPNCTDIVIKSISAYQLSSEAEIKLLQCDLTQLKYFISLSEYSSKKTTFNKEACPICYEDLGISWMVLLCSHFICYECYKTFIKHVEHNNIECPICRFESPSNDIFYINTDPNSASNSTNLVLPTKISKIISLVKEIFESTDDKIIIFSEWDSILEICKTELHKNNFNICVALNINQLRSELPIFLENPNYRILIMNLRLGSKGITITCANQIIFADVCLNGHDEIQAIGRCRRIGQTKYIPLYFTRVVKVYHLMMKMSIEEKIFKNRHVTGSWLSLKRKKTFTSNEAIEFLKFNEDKFDLDDNLPVS